MRTDSHLPRLHVYVVCTDGRCRHTTPFPEESAAEQWADTGHICCRRHWLNYSRIDNDTVSRWTATVALAGIDRRAARPSAPVTATQCSESARGDSTEANHWRAVLDRLDWLNRPQVL